MKRILLNSLILICMAGGACAPVMELEEAEIKAVQEELVQKKENQFIRGVIMPHHELAKEMIEDAWEIALEGEPDLIVLIGPDHPGLAAYPLIWTEETKSLVSFTCSAISKRWIKEGVGGVAIAADHSIETPLKFLPEGASQIPVLATTLPKGMDTEQLNCVIEAIQAIAAKEILLVGSVDFSHGLISEESEGKDTISFQWIQERNMDAIRSAGNEYFDSPETIEVLLHCVSGEIERIDRRDSSDFGCGKELLGTSYQVILINQ